MTQIDQQQQMHRDIYVLVSGLAFTSRTFEDQHKTLKMAFDFASLATKVYFDKERELIAEIVQQSKKEK